MPRLEWSDGLSLDLPIMDETHREFVELLGLAQGSTDEALPASWWRLIEHTAEHFGQEDRWMQATRFAASNCHSVQHKVVLEVMHEGMVQAANGDLASLRAMAGELALWFPKHAQSMDAALALHLRRAGYDPVTGVVSCPDALPAVPIQGCMDATCSWTSPPPARTALA